MKYTAILLLLAACSNDGPGTASLTGDKTAFVIYTVNYPLQYFAQRLGGDRVVVHMPAARDEDPAFWEPDEASIAKYQAADMIVLNGASYAKWTNRATLPDDILASTCLSFTDKFIGVESAKRHKHGPDGVTHGHGGIAFTTWLDMLQAIEQARAITEALGDRAQGFDALERDLIELDAALQKTGVRGRLVLASHPVYQYFARRYGANLRSVHFEPGQEPSALEWNKLVELHRAHPAKLMLWEGEPAPATKRKLEAMGIKSVVFDPCGNVPETGDFLTVMRANIDRLTIALH